MTAPQGVSKSLLLNNLLVIPIRLKLNMEHFMGMAFWIFTFSVALSDTRPTNYLLDFQIESMTKNVKCENDSVFYTPKPTEKCFMKALKCIYEELKGVAKVECEDRENIIDVALLALKWKMKTQESMEDTAATTDTNECACEKWKESSFTEFLDNYKSLLQMENAKSDSAA